VAGWIKASVASVATHTVAGSNLAAGGIFLRASHGIRRKVQPSPTRAWQIPIRMPNKKICQTKNPRVYKLTIFPVQTKNKQLMAFMFNLKKKFIYIILFTAQYHAARASQVGRSPWIGNRSE